jgi:hypothetical protein
MGVPFSQVIEATTVFAVLPKKLVQMVCMLRRITDEVRIRSAALLFRNSRDLKQVFAHMLPEENSSAFASALSPKLANEDILYLKWKEQLHRS